MDESAVPAFHDQPLTDHEHLEFARRLDGELHTKAGSRALMTSRLGNEALGDRTSTRTARCRELRRVTTLDIRVPVVAAGSS